MLSQNFRLSTLEQFRDYMFRKLGEEFWEVEISDEQYRDIFRDSMKTYLDYSESGTYTTKVLIDTNNSRSLLLPEEIIGIKRILGATKQKIDVEMAQNIAISGEDTEKQDWITGYDNNSIIIVPTVDVPIAAGGEVAGDGTTPEPFLSVDGNPLTNVPEMDAYSNSSIYSPLGTDMGYSMGAYLPFLIYGQGNTGSDLNLSTYAITMQTINTIKDIFKNEIYYQFKSETKRLILGESVEMLLVEAIVRDSPENFFNDDFFKKIMEEKMLTQWGDNLSLKYESEGLMGNGINLNTQRIFEKAELLRDQIENGFENDEWDGLLAPIRLN